MTLTYLTVIELPWPVLGGQEDVGTGTIQYGGEGSCVDGGEKTLLAASRVLPQHPRKRGLGNSLN